MKNQTKMLFYLKLIFYFVLIISIIAYTSNVSALSSFSTLDQKIDFNSYITIKNQDNQKIEIFNSVNDPINNDSIWYTIGLPNLISKRNKFESDLISSGLFILY